MNKILNYGYVRPFIQFQFENGQTIDTIPPRYFASFQQKRTVKEACTFELRLQYVPGNFNEETASIIHGLLLNNVNNKVTYRYGYKVPGQYAPICQNQYYSGIFTTYSETINDGVLEYVISGISECVNLFSQNVQVQDFIRLLGGMTQIIKPSAVVKELIYNATSTGIPQLFDGFKIDISEEDEPVSVRSINIEDGPLHDVFFGSVDTDGTKLPGGLVSLSHKNVGDAIDIMSRLLSDQVAYNKWSEYYYRNRYISSSLSKEELGGRYSGSKYDLTKITKIPFICYYDNVIDSIGSSDKGSFHYVPKYNNQPTSIFTYAVGNNIIDSDVLSFSCTYDCITALASKSALNTVESDIDVGGEAISSNYVSLQTNGFTVNTYNTPSGFDESVIRLSNTFANAFNYPLEAEMTIVGQTDCNQLLDVIEVYVYVNGVKHEALTGKYVIMEISDSLSEDGFTTTFKLNRYTATTSDAETPDIINNYNAGTRAYQNEQALQNDYVRNS